MSEMQLSAGVEVKFGGMRAMIYGGPYRKYVHGTRRLIGVKMAAEITHPHHISIPTRDFSVPDTGAMLAGMHEAIKYIFAGNDIYAGCIGGIGRTGLFMGCMAKLMRDYEVRTYGPNSPSQVGDDPVKFVRKHYMSHSIETDAQMDFVRRFDTLPLQRLLDSLLNPPTLTNTVIEVREVVVKQTCWESFKNWVSGTIDK